MSSAFVPVRSWTSYSVPGDEGAGLRDDELPLSKDVEGIEDPAMEGAGTVDDNKALLFTSCNSSCMSLTPISFGSHGAEGSWNNLTGLDFLRGLLTSGMTGALNIGRDFFGFEGEPLSKSDWLWIFGLV